MAKLISSMELLHDTQKAYLIVTFHNSDTVGAQNFIAESTPKFVAIITLADDAKMVWIVK